MEPAPESIPAIVLARLDSTRLPRKALADLGGRPLVAAAIERARAARLGPVALAATSRPVDADLAAWVRDAGIPLFRDDADVSDVAGRLLRAAGALAPRAEWIARVNADSPFLDPRLLRAGAALITPGTDYVTNLIPRTYPYGVAVELLRVSALRRFADAGLTAEEREHATLALRTRLPAARIASLPPCPFALADERLTVDTPHDLDRLRAIVKDAGPAWTKKSYAQLLRAHQTGAPA